MPNEDKKNGKPWIDWKSKDESADKSIEALLSDEYKDAGYWARHYSTVRLTLGTFFLTAATAVITQRLDQPDWRVAILASSLALFGVVLFCIFSRLTYNEMNRQLKIVNSYREKLLPAQDFQPIKMYKWIKAASGGCAAGVFVLFFLGLVFVWLNDGFAPNRSLAEQGTTSTTQLSLDVKVGGSDPVTLQIPITVTAKTPEPTRALQPR